MDKFIDKLYTFEDYVEMGGVAIEAIEIAEQQLGVSFSDEYRNYLLKCGCASANGHEFTGICASARINVVNVTILRRKNTKDIMKNAYVVEEMLIDGIVIWQTTEGQIYKSQGNRFDKICENLFEFIELFA